jgi:hypothetical protein
MEKKVGMQTAKNAAMTGSQSESQQLPGINQQVD